MSIKKRVLSAVTAVVLAVASVMGFSGCSSQVNYAMEIDGEKIPAGLYILFSGYAYQQAQQQLMEEKPDLDTSAEGFDYTAQKVSDMDFMDYVKQEALNCCKRYTAVEKLFDQLSISFTADEKSEINNSVSSQWDYEVPDWISSSMPYIKGFATVGDYYESIGVSKSSLKLYITDSMKATKIFNYYYGEGGIEEVSKADKEKWLEENYALCRYFPISIKDSSGNVIESKTELAIIKQKAEEYAKKLKDGESYKDVYNEYVEYSKAQTSSAATTTPAETAAETTAADAQGRQAAESDVTTAAVEETQPEEVTTDNAAQAEEVTTVSEEETEPVEATADTTTAAEPAETTTSAAATTPASSETGTGTTTSEVKDSDYDRIVGKEATSPSEKFVKSLFDMGKEDAAVIEEDTAYYVVQRLDILKSDQDYAKKYDSNALQGLKGDEMEAAFKKEYENYAVTENSAAPDYCKQQASNAMNALNAINQIQYLIYYYSSMFGGIS